MRDTQYKGDVAVAQAIASFTKLRMDVSIPLTESAAYDLVVDNDHRLMRVQVRYTSTDDVELRRIHSNSTGYVIKKTAQNAYDWLYVLHKTGKEYLIPKCLDGRRAVRVNDKYELKHLSKLHKFNTQTP
ncbi:hypothetical protein KDA23_00805 [Candidatus Saccharibacteria bacterium]|nr:hypothetical protein [Candidatus Saccharibacteria bacterium]